MVIVMKRIFIPSQPPLSCRSALAALSGSYLDQKSFSLGPNLLNGAGAVSLPRFGLPLNGLTIGDHARKDGVYLCHRRPLISNVVAESYQRVSYMSHSHR